MAGSSEWMENQLIKTVKQVYSESGLVGVDFFAKYEEQLNTASIQATNDNSPASKAIRKFKYLVDTKEGDIFEKFRCVAKQLKLKLGNDYKHVYKGWITNSEFADLFDWRYLRLFVKLSPPMSDEEMRALRHEKKRYKLEGFDVKPWNKPSSRWHCIVDLYLQLADDLSNTAESADVSSIVSVKSEPPNADQDTSVKRCLWNPDQQNSDIPSQPQPLPPSQNDIIPASQYSSLSDSQLVRHSASLLTQTDTQNSSERSLHNQDNQPTMEELIAGPSDPDAHNPIRLYYKRKLETMEEEHQAKMRVLRLQESVAMKQLLRLENNDNIDTASVATQPYLIDEQDINSLL